jgi:hypothetical protein
MYLTGLIFFMGLFFHRTRYGKFKGRYNNSRVCRDTEKSDSTQYTDTFVNYNLVDVGRVAQSVSDWLRAGRSGDRNQVGARYSAPVQTGPWAHPASCTMVTGSFPGVESGRGVTLTPHPLLVPRS